MSVNEADLVLLGKAGIAVAAAMAAFIAVRLPALDRLSPRTFDRLALAVLVASRAAVAILVYGALGLRPLSDVTVYATEGNAVLAGQVPFRDFFTAYSPLFPGVIALILSVWNDPVAIVCITIAVEAITLLLWMPIARNVADESAVRDTAVLAALSPISLVAVPLGGQNHVWLALSLVASLFALLRGHPATSGLAFAAGVSLVKWLSIIHAPVLWCRVGWSLRWLAAALATPVAVYAAWWCVSGGALVENAAFHASEFSSGNLPFLLTALGLDLGDPWVARIANLVLVAALAGVFVPAVIRFGRFNERQCVLMLAAVTLVLLLFSKKAHPQYILIALFPITLALAMPGPLKDRVLALAAFLLFSVASAVESSLWYRWLDHRQMNCLVAGNSAEAIATWKSFAFLSVELLLVSGYAWCAFLIMHGLRSLPPTHSST